MIHHSTVGHLLRRSLDNQPNPQTPLDQLRESVSPAGFTLILLTFLTFIVLIISIRYTLLGVVATLAQVESPQHNYVPLEQNPKPFNDAGEPVPPSDPEVVPVQSEAVTGSIRRTLRHLTARAGFFSRWRGAACALCITIAYQICFQLLHVAFSLILPFGLTTLLAGVLTSILLARWTMAWTHIVISEPSSQRWYRRVPSFNSWRKIWAPTAINALLAHMAFIVPGAMWFAFGFNNAQKMREVSPASAAWKVVSLLVVGLLVYIAVVIPSEVALTRCQASMLPEEDESVVYFDRSYGGKVEPEIVGGSGMLSYVDAWKSFSKMDKVRIVKLYLKIFAIDIALHLFWGILLTMELYLVLGPAVDKALKGVQDGQQQA